MFWNVLLARRFRFRADRGSCVHLVSERATAFVGRVSRRRGRDQPDQRHGGLVVAEGCRVGAQGSPCRQLRLCPLHVVIRR